MNTPTTYTFTEGLVQAIVSNLNAQPAAHSRQLLNVIEGECLQQDQTRAAEAQATLRTEIEAQVKAELQKPPADPSQAPAGAPPGPAPTTTDQPA